MNENEKAKEARDTRIVELRADMLTRKTTVLRDGKEEKPKVLLALFGFADGESLQVADCMLSDLAAVLAASEETAEHLEQALMLAKLMAQAVTAGVAA